MSMAHDDASSQRPKGSVSELMFGAFDEQDLDEIPGATHWPEIPAVDAEGQWEELRSWVEELQDRFAHLDHHVIPRCWWRHNEHVEALSALRDHERSSFSDTAPATAPFDWFRALRDVTALLRAWTGELSCGAVHQDPPSNCSSPGLAEWEDHKASDVAGRKERELRLFAGDAALARSASPST